MFKRGNIHIANLNPNKANEVGKVRPILIMQSNYLNEVMHPTIVIIPLTTVLIDNSFLRYRLSATQKLKQDSDVLCDQIKSIDAKRIDSEVLYSLSTEELQEIDDKVKIILGFNY
jgi:mRNA interferase MazF